MAGRSQVFEHLGAYAKHPPIATLCDLTERAWHAYHELAGGYQHQGQQSREYLIARLLYIAELTSTAVRLNTSWALTLPAMSLLRDRYEQTVRFSWLVRNPDPSEFHKYERSLFAKTNSLFRQASEFTQQAYEEVIGSRPPEWALETLTKEQRAYLDAWGQLDLKSMAEKRDAFPPLADTTLAKEKLLHWYPAIYAQFSSVAHYDRYSVELLGLHQSPSGGLVLSTSPHWPGILILQNCYFDLIQCFEAAQVCHKTKAAQRFELLLAEWLVASRAVTD